ncbi:C40 family peptidase [Burkholderia lata]|uniref:C40 family peptidase n=1 Tax=Burkholderia lata (strain ATCC 17760 / DSM 23089 / LMG 22485 / NCIMB 9086 / R18194 / 383) TaxID=482957 RepID=UPI0015820D50|nr:C40 family peptidase [Burkholderia lata]
MRKARNELPQSSLSLGKVSTIAIAVIAALVMTSTCRADPIDQQIDDKSSLSSEVSSSTAAESTLERVQSEALRFIGVRYRYGGSTPQTGFDCSGFVRYVLYHATQLNVARTSTSIAAEGRQVQRVDLRTGDLVFFNTRGKAYSHVGIYLGGRRFIHSPSKGGRVRVDDLDGAYWQAHYSGARRLFL